MSITVEIESPQIVTKKGTSAKGKDYQIHEQAALMFKEGSRYPDKVKVVVVDGQSAYQPGRYTLHQDSFQVSRFGAIELRPVLVPITKSA
jgi:hypothetical protein|tara:strand:- start:271 stop:540 length:270 start_codon:yes stop_codon:yes gene_type:complete